MLRKVPLYPFLFAIWPPLALAAKNVTELGSLAALITPVSVGTTVAAVGWLVIWLVRAPLPAAPLVAALAGLWWWGFRWLVHQFQGSPIIHTIGLGRFGGWLALLLLLLVATLLVRAVGRGLREPRVFLNTAGLLLCVASLSQLTAGSLRYRAQMRGLPRPAIEVAAPAHAPDVYLIILDSYTGSSSLAEQYGFDNRAFEDSLRARGFFVPTTARANYTQTFLALAAMLNWGYVQDLPGTSVLEPDAGEEALYHLLTYNRTFDRFLRSGYSLEFHRSPTAYTWSHPWADRHVPARATREGNFSAYWPRMTPVPEVRRMICRVRECTPGDFEPWVPQSANVIDQKFRSLVPTIRSESPRLVFAHFMAPHEPFIYKADCSHRLPPYWPDRVRLSDTTPVLDAYVDQLQCVNTKLHAFLDRALADEGPTPIIILQSDHGQAFTKQPVPASNEIHANGIGQRLDIFAAYFAPDSLLTRLYDSVTPVNAIRLLLGDSAGHHLPRLADRSYWSSRAEPFRFTVVPPPLGAVTLPP